MEKIVEVQKKILTDPQARKAFAADPRGFLTKEGVSIPEGMSLPSSVPLADFEKRVAIADQRLKAKGVDINKMTAQDLKKAELSEADLEQVSGGMTATLQTTTIGTTTMRAPQTAAAVALLVVAVGIGVWSSL